MIVRYDEIWEDLIIAVLKQAKSDYIAALKRKNYAEMNELEDFFLSDYGQAMSRNQGERIIELCKRIVEEQKRKRRKKK